MRSFGVWYPGFDVSSYNLCDVPCLTLKREFTCVENNSIMVSGKFDVGCETSASINQPVVDGCEINALRYH